MKLPTILILVILLASFGALGSDAIIPKMSRQRTQPNRDDLFLNVSGLPDNTSQKFFHLKVFGESFTLHELDPDGLRIGFKWLLEDGGLSERNYISDAEELLRFAKDHGADGSETFSLENLYYDLSQADIHQDPDTKYLPVPVVPGFHSIEDYYQFSLTPDRPDKYSLTKMQRIYRIDETEITVSGNYEVIPGFVKTRMASYKGKLNILPAHEVRTLLRYIKDEPLHEISPEFRDQNFNLRFLTDTPVGWMEGLQARYPVAGTILILLLWISLLFLFIWIKARIFRAFMSKFEPQTEPLGFGMLYWLTARLFLSSSMLSIGLSLLVIIAVPFLILIPIAVTALETIVYAKALNERRSRCLMGSLVSNFIVMAIVGALLTALLTL